MTNPNKQYKPYHLNTDKLISEDSCRPNAQDKLYKKDELGIIRAIYKEPYAFYLTEEDKQYYDDAALRAFKTVQDIAIKKFESENLNIQTK